MTRDEGNNSMKSNTISVFLAADSTVRDYDDSQFPQAGWGQFLPDYLSEELAVKNHAVGGKSSKTFIMEGYFAGILSEIQADDYLIIQFGHNDSTKDRPERYTDAAEDYKTYLQQYIDQARVRQAIPILCTPVATLRYVNHIFLTEFDDYCEAMKEVAQANGVPIIDLMEKSMNLLRSIGYEEAKELYMMSVNGTDDVHFTRKGAKAIAKLVRQGIKEQVQGLAPYIV